MATTDDIKQLRAETGVSVMECKKALDEAGGDKQKAKEILYKKSGAVAGKKAGRALGAGTIAAYIHAGGTVGAMVELSCETDFVARNEEFRKLAYDIAMHVAATDPKFIGENDITDTDKKEMGDFYEREVAEMDKPEEVKSQILQNKIDTYFKENTLLAQPFVKDSEKTIADLIEQAVQKFGERTEITNMARFAI